MLAYPASAQDGDDPPEKPKGLQMKVVSGVGVNLSWNDPSDDTVTGYEILRSTGGKELTILEDNIAVTCASCTDTSASETGATYTHQVKALRDGEPSQASNRVVVELPEGASNSPADGEPFIGGTVQVEATLTADTSDIADEDGMDGASFSYQWIARGSDISEASASSHALHSDQQGQTIQVRVSFTDDADNQETLTNAATTAVATTPLTASFVDMPEIHDGQTASILEFRFSDEPHPKFSYSTPRDDAFTQTDGDVIKARRINKPSNMSWEIHVQPHGDAAVTLVLAETTNCTATGAICTGDGRMPSNRLELTVAGREP